jgi:Lon protease-like protein
LPRLLPLFPLDLVLLPGTSLPLHIFEPRYKEMIGECLDEHRPFGIVRAQSEGIALVGCTAEILEVVRRYPDGRLDILAEGHDRFEVTQVSQEREFLQAEVVYFSDEPALPTRDRIERMQELHQQLVALSGEKKESPQLSDSGLSFQLASSLPLDLDFKQALLSLRSEEKRVEAMIQCYETLIPGLTRALHAQKRAGGNGHVH